MKNTRHTIIFFKHVLIFFTVVEVKKLNPEIIMYIIKAMNPSEFKEAMAQLARKQVAEAAEAEKSKREKMVEELKTYQKSLPECRRLMFNLLASDIPYNCLTVPVVLRDDFIKEMAEYNIKLERHIVPSINNIIAYWVYRM